MGSATESECHLMLAREFGYIDDETYSKLCYQINEIQKSIGAFIKAIT